MIKIFIRNIFLVLLFFTISCTYEPIFSSKDYGFQINEINFIGDKTVNKNIKNKLNLINSSNTANRKFNLLINSEKERKIISKDSRGDPSKFELELNTYLEISNEEKILIKREIKKNYIYNSESDKFKLEQNEVIIIQNLSEKISEVIISSIMNLDDN